MNPAYIFTEKSQWSMYSSYKQTNKTYFRAISNAELFICIFSIIFSIREREREMTDGHRCSYREFEPIRADTVEVLHNKRKRNIQQMVQHFILHIYFCLCQQLNFLRGPYNAFGSKLILTKCYM